MRALLAASLLASLALPAWAVCADDKVTLQGDWGQATFTVAVADDAQERAQGLMFVETMPTLSGMLFVYDRPQPVSFWMKNTLIPLDMLFAGADGTILRIHENAIPGDLTPIPGGEQIQFVLEINGGLSGRLGITEGDLMQHPSMGSDAILACDENSQS